MNGIFRTIWALSIALCACGNGHDLLLDQTSTALGCGAPGEAACTRSDDTAEQHTGAYGDAGASRDGTRECRRDADCGYAEVCERRHGVSSCLMAHDGHAAVGASADAGAAACHDDTARAPHGGLGERDEDDEDGARDEDRSGSNSGRH